MTGLLSGRGVDGITPRENGDATTVGIDGDGNGAPSAEETRCEAWCWTHGGARVYRPARPCSRPAVVYDPVCGAFLCWRHEMVDEPCLSASEAAERGRLKRAEYRARHDAKATAVS